MTQNEKNRGSLTVESVFILIYIIGVVFILVHLAHGIYQRTYMQSVANEGVEMAQRYWLNDSKVFQTGKIESANHILYAPLYRYPIDIRTQSKKAKVEQYLKLRLYQNQSYDVFNYKGQSSLVPTCEVEDLLIYKKIVVTITDTKVSKFKVFRNLFGLPKNSEIQVKAEGVILDPAEYIRTLGLGKDLILETEAGQKVAGKMEEWRGSLNKYLNMWSGDAGDVVE